MDATQSQEPLKVNGRLQDLPPEVVEWIARMCDRRDILQLRGTSRKLRSKVDNAFLETFFHSRTHLYTKHSLDVLVNITANPGLLTKMNTIEILFWEVIERWDSKRLLSHSSLGLEAGPLARADTYLAAWLFTCQEKLALRTNETGIRLLAKALKALDDANVTVRLIGTDCCFDLEHNQNPEDGLAFKGGYLKEYPFGLRSFIEAMGIPEYNDWMPRTGYPAMDIDLGTGASVLLSAIADAEYAVDALGLKLRPHSWRHAMTAVAESRLDRLYNCLYYTRILDLMILNLRFNGLPALPIEIDPLLDFVGYMEELNEFHICCPDALLVDQPVPEGGDEDEEGEEEGEEFRVDAILRNVTNALTTDKLDTIEISHTIISRSDLQSLLGRHASTLRTLSLNSVHLTHHDSWIDVFTWMRKHLQLWTLEMMMLTQDVGVCVVGRTAWDGLTRSGGSYRWSSTESHLVVDEGLRRLVHDKEYAREIAITEPFVPPVARFAEDASSFWHVPEPTTSW